MPTSSGSAISPLAIVSEKCLQWGGGNDGVGQMIDVANLNRACPKYPITVQDKGWIYGVWYCPTAWMKTHFHGQFPLTFLKRVIHLFPNAKDILQCPCGTVMGPGITVDLISDEKRKPQIIGSAEALPFKENTFDLYLSDPPYTNEDSKKYGTPPFKLVKAMAEARRVLKPGGYYCLLHTRYPTFKRGTWNFVALIGIVTGANRCVRLLSIFQKPFPKVETPDLFELCQTKPTPPPTSSAGAHCRPSGASPIAC